MRVEFSNESENALEQIGDFIAKHNPRRAYSFMRELCSKCEALADMADSFPLVPRYERHGYRRRVHRNYLIFYRADDDRVWIVRILHGSMDYAAILFED
jgi:toxin ParE1/3/4